MMTPERLQELKNCYHTGSRMAISTVVTELLAEIERLTKELADCAEKQECTCGSGAHPRACKRHPQGMELHVSKLNYENAIASVNELEAGNARLREALEDAMRLLYRKGKAKDER